MSDAATSDAKKDEKDQKPLEDQVFVTKHSVKIGKTKVDYTAKVGRQVVHSDDEQGKPKVAIFYTAYIREGADIDRASRPLLFFFNGGPGSSTVWLHMYSFGPRRIKFAKDPSIDPTRWELVENDQSLLDVADIIFIDPPGTGFSRMAPGEDPEQFEGVNSDAKVIGDFIHEFVNRELRMDSPVVIAGESYGTLRAPAVAEYLQRIPGLYVDGVALISSIMDVSSVQNNVATVNGAWSYLPTFAAVANYHGKVEGELHSLVAEAEDFALNELSVAVTKGSRLTETEQQKIAKRVSKLSGLSVDYVRKSNLRVSLWGYMKELLRDENKTVGRIDGRFLGRDSNQLGEMWEDDASMSNLMGPASRALNTYLVKDLGWQADRNMEYRIIRGKIKWKLREETQMGIWTPQLETASLLRLAMNRAPGMKVLLINGLYDLATPHFPAELTFDQLNLTPAIAANLTKKRYEAGHMEYIHEPSLAQMRKDFVEWLKTLRTGVN